jgi:hypothetical protein
MPDYLLEVLRFVLTVVFLGLGGILLLAGRQYLWILLGGGGFLIAAAIAAEFEGLANDWALVQELQWLPLLFALVVGILGIYIGRRYKNLAADLIGFGVGVLIATWLDEILLVMNNQEASELTWWVILLFIVAGFIGVWITRQDRDQALILISVIIGSNTIINVLDLDQSKNYTAVISLSLALTGVVLQYAAYLRENPRIGKQLPPVPHPFNDELPYE